MRGAVTGEGAELTGGLPGKQGLCQAQGQCPARAPELGKRRQEEATRSQPWGPTSTQPWVIWNGQGDPKARLVLRGRGGQLPHLSVAQVFFSEKWG